MKYTYQTDGPRGPPAFYWRKNMKHILSCSFGKDSIATALLALQHGEPPVSYTHLTLPTKA